MAMQVLSFFFEAVGKAHIYPINDWAKIYLQLAQLDLMPKSSNKDRISRLLGNTSLVPLKCCPQNVSFCCQSTSKLNHMD